MPSSDETIHFSEITLKSPLPLNQYLIENPRLSLRLLVNDTPCGETSTVDGNLETGKWVFSSSLYLPPESDLFRIAVIVHAGKIKIQLLSITHRVDDIVSWLKGQPNGFCKIEICGPEAPIQFSIIGKVELSPPSSTISPLLAIDNEKDGEAALIERESTTETSLEEDDQTLPSRDKLEAFYLVATEMDDLGSKATAFSLLGRTYHALYQQTNQLVDLEYAISMHDEAIKLTSISHSELAERSEYAADALMVWFERSGDTAAVTKAVSVYEVAVRVTDDKSPAKARHLSNLGLALYQRYKRLGNSPDLDSAIVVLQKAVELTPDGHPDKPSHLSNHEVSILARSQRLGNLPDMDNVITVRRQAAEIIPDDHPDKPSRLYSLGHSLQLRFKRLGNLADIEDAITVHQKAAEITPDDHPEKPSRLNGHGVALLSRFERLGNLVDVENAIRVYKKAIEITPDGHPDKPFYLSNHGNSLLARFEHLENLVDIDNVITIHQQAAEITPDDHPEKPSRLSNLGTSLRLRFERLRNPDDMENAILAYKKAAEIAPDGHPDKPTHLSNHGNSLLDRFRWLENLPDLDNAIMVQQQAVKITPDGHPDKPSRLNNYGISLLSRFKVLENPADVDNAIAVLQKAVETTLDGHPNKPSYLSSHGNSLLARFQRVGDPVDLENALKCLSKAALSQTGPARGRFEAARAWAAASSENSQTPLPAFKCAIDLLPRIAWVGIMPTDQHALLADIGDVVRDAVAAAIEYEEYEAAVEWAEQGRSIVWQNLLGLRSPLDDLMAVNHELANLLQSIARQLESPVSGSVVSGTAPTKPAEDVVRSYSQLGTDWDDTVEKIRRLPNFEEFLKPKIFSKLAPVAAEGPVVILNVHESRSDALVIIPDDSNASHFSVICIPLETYIYLLSEELSADMDRLLFSAGVRSRGIHEYTSTQFSTLNGLSSFETCKQLFEDLEGRLSISEVRASERVTMSLADDKLDFHTILGFLWLAVVKPVLDGLGFSAEPADPLPRIWWCATGPLAFLPIHAAGIYGSGEIGDTISEYVVSSYTPTLAAILDHLQPIIQPDFQLLTVAVAESKYAKPIPGTNAEVTTIQGLAEACGVRCVNLTKEGATVEQVVQEMKESNWIHLACHGKQNSMQSSFLLQDGNLELSAMVGLSLPKVDFAFLSACQTATGDEKVAEESVHLAAGMLMVGCKGVIATMWSISDNDAPGVAEDVYRHMLKDGKPNRKEAAYALHAAVKRLRESGADFLSWVPFIHIGR